MTYVIIHVNDYTICDPYKISIQHHEFNSMHTDTFIIKIKLHISENIS